MPRSPEQLERKAAIATNLVRIETEKPGSIRLAPNAWHLRSAVEVLGQAGFRKPFLARSRQFVIDTFLSHQTACNLLLDDCLLVGPRDSEFRYPIWSGVGGFRAWLCPLPLLRADDPQLFIINIAPIILELIGDARYFFHLLELDESVVKLLRSMHATNA
jgi:hypothetical protein